MKELTYWCDNKRHLICVPYSIKNLHKMSDDLNIKRCWFHKNHYDIPKKRIGEITSKCELVSTREIGEMISLDCLDQLCYKVLKYNDII